MNKNTENVVAVHTHRDVLDNNKNKKIYERDIYENASNCGVQNNSAITLVALVITVIVLLILAGVTLNMVMGENGIIRKAQLAKEATDNSAEEENKKIAGYESEIDNIITNNRETIEIKDMKDYVIDYGISEDSSKWYRKYKSGWIEQGGKITPTSIPCDVEFLIPFQTDNYTIITQPIFEDAYVKSILISSMERNLFTFKGVTDGGGYYVKLPMCWEAKGY